MKTIPAGLQAHLDAGTTTLAWCWRILRADGAAFGFTDHDRTLSIDGLAYEPESGFTAAELRSGSDLAVDAQDAGGVLSSGRITETDILDGRWDNATVEVWRVNWRDPAERVLLRRGSIGEIRRGRTAFVAEVRSLAHVLGQTVGRTFQACCDAALGDDRCRVDLAAPAFRGAGSVGDVMGDRSFLATGLGGFAAGWFGFGLLDWTSGANTARRAELLTHEKAGASVILRLLAAPVRSIELGDAFVIRAGCDKRGDLPHPLRQSRELPRLPDHPRPGRGHLLGQGRRRRNRAGAVMEGSGLKQLALKPSVVVAAGRAWLGTRYHQQASLRGVGCDCLGLARGVWRELVGSEPLPLPPYSRDWGETGGREVLVEETARVMLRIDVAVAGPGAVVLFRMRDAAVVKHVGILTSATGFVHAYERLGVIEERLTPAWRRRIAFAFLFPGGV